MNGSETSGGKKGDSLSEALSAYKNLTSRFDAEMRSSSASCEIGIEIPLAEMLKVIPDRCLDKSRPAGASDTVFVPIPNLLDQLRKGKVLVSVQNLVACVPAAMALPEAFDDKTEVSIPLSLVVSAMDPALLARQASAGQTEKEYNIADIPDPFKRGHAEPRQEIPIPSRVETPPPAPREQPQAKTVAPEIAAPSAAFIATEPIVSPEPAERPAAVVPQEQPAIAEAEAPAAPPEAPIAISPAPPEERETPSATRAPEERKKVAEEIPEPAIVEEIGPPGGVNLNACDYDHLVSVEGVSSSLARKILDYRAAHGPFGDIFALRDVPGLGKKTFKLMTGMPHSVSKRHRALKLAKLLGIPPANVAHIPTLAQAIAKLPGFSGCVVSDRDGMVVAASEASPLAEAIGPVAHEILSQTRRSMEMAGAQDVDSISMSVKLRMFTIVRCGDVYLTAVHESNRITATTLSLILKVAAELTWALSRRVYVG